MFSRRNVGVASCYATLCPAGIQVSSRSGAVGFMPGEVENGVETET